MRCRSRFEFPRGYRFGRLWLVGSWRCDGDRRHHRRRASDGALVHVAVRYPWGRLLGQGVCMVWWEVDGRVEHNVLVAPFRTEAEGPEPAAEPHGSSP
jgi:hypothetical protein